MAQEKSSFKSKVLSGFLWLGAGTFISQFISWLSTIIVIRLLEPSDYGLMAMSAIFIAFLAIVSELGINAALIQSEHLDNEKISQVSGIVMFTCLGGLILSYLLAPLIALFYNMREIVLPIRVLSLSFIFTATYLIPQSLLIREMDFKTKTHIDIFAQVGASILTLILAFKGMGVWALIFGALVMHFIKAIGFNITHPSWVRPVFKYKGAENLFNYGVFVTGDRILYYLYTVSDQILVGRFLGDSLLGIYAVANNLSSMITGKILPIVTQVTFTAYSRIQDDMERIKKNLLSSTHLIAFFIFPFFFGMAATAPEAIPLILGEKWKSIVVPFQLLSLIMPLKALSVLIPPAIFAVGKPRINFENMAITFLLMFIAFLGGIRYGIIGICISWLAIYPIVFSITTIRCLNVLHIGFKDYIAEIISPFFLSVIIIGGIYLAKNRILLILKPSYSLAIIIFLSVVIYFGFIGIFKKDEYLKIKALLQR